MLTIQMSLPSDIASDDEGYFDALVGWIRRQGLNALFGLFSVCIGRNEWAMAPTCGMASRLSHFRLASMVIVLEALAAGHVQKSGD